MRRPLWLVAFALFASCEPPRSKNPLSDPETAKPDARLTGVWAGRLGEKAEVTLTFSPRSHGRVDLVIVGSDGDNGSIVLSFAGFPSTIAGKTYLNLRAKTFVGDYAEKSQVAERWIFARCDFDKDGTLTLLNMTDAPVKAAIAAGKLAGSGSDNIELTATTAQLAAFVAAADPAALFEPFGTFKRAHLDYPKAAPPRRQ